MTEEILQQLGPLAQLAGVWEGEKGDDTAPSDNRGTEQNKFRERIVLEAMGPVNNHEQTLYGLRYSTTRTVTPSPVTVTVCGPRRNWPLHTISVVVPLCTPAGYR